MSDTMNLKYAVRPLFWILTSVACAFLGSSAAQAQDRQEGPGTAPVSGRQPIVTNQFTAATGGAIQNRRPGLYVQQGIAVHEGTTGFFTGVPDEPPNFLRDTLEQILFEAFDVIQGFMDGIQLFISSLTGQSSGSSGRAAFVPISNAATTGQGTTVQIP